MCLVWGRSGGSNPGLAKSYTALQTFHHRAPNRWLISIFQLPSLGRSRVRTHTHINHSRFKTCGRLIIPFRPGCSTETRIKLFRLQYLKKDVRFRVATSWSDFSETKVRGSFPAAVELDAELATVCKVATIL